MIKILNRIKPYFINIRYFIKQNPIFWIFLLLGLVIFTNQLHFSYEDEFENILGGQYLINFKFAYRDFFTHHNPGAFFLSAVINLFSGVSFVRFRILLGVVYLISYILFYLFIKKRFGNIKAKLLIFFYFFITFGATYFWGQMLLADSLSAYLLTAAYIICLLLVLKNDFLTKNDLWIISLLTSFTIITTPTQSYAGLMIYIFVFILNIKHKLISWKNFFSIIFLPFLIFLGYLLVTGSIIEYYWQAIYFNVSYYVQLPDGVSPKNPLRVGIVLLVNFYNNFRPALLQVKDFSLGSPFVHALAISNLALIVFFIFKRKYYLIIFIWVFLSFINVRGNPYQTSETDYQTIVYHFVSIFNGILAMLLLWKETNLEQQTTKKFILNILIIFLGIYQIALFAFFFDKWQDKTYKKFMGAQSLIYDNPSIATVLNDFISKDEYYFIAPFDFENQLYMKSKLATKYLIVLPGMDKSPRIQGEILADLRKNKPKIIVFNTEMSIYEAYPGKFLRDYLNEEYINLAAMGVPCNGYSTKQKMYGNYDFERHFFLDKNQKDQLWNLMLQKGYLYPIPKEEVSKIPLCIQIEESKKRQ